MEPWTLAAYLLRPEKGKPEYYIIGVYDTHAEAWAVALSRQTAQNYPESHYDVGILEA